MKSTPLIGQLYDLETKLCLAFRRRSNPSFRSIVYELTAKIRNVRAVLGMVHDTMTPWTHL